MRLTASLLAFAIVLSAPGLAPYAAFAAVVAPRVSAPVALPAGASAARLGGLSAAQLGVSPLGATLMPSLANRIPAAQLAPSMPASLTAAPAAAAPLAAAPSARVAVAADAALAAPQNAPAPGALESGRALEAALSQPSHEAAPAQQGSTLGRFYEGRAFSAAADAPTPAGDEKPAESGLTPAGSNAKVTPAVPVSPDNHPEMFPKRSSRMGIGPVRYVYWNAFYNIMQWANLKFAKDPNRRVSWDKWPTKLGLLYLIAKIRFLRSDTLTDPYDYASNDVKPAGAEPEQAKRGYTADGSWALDRENPRMGAENTRFGSNIPPKKVRPDVENMTPSAREVGKLRHREQDPNTGKDIVKPAGILNDLAGGWIQFQFHNFGGNTKRDPITQNPHVMPRNESDKWPEKEALLDRTSKDPTRVTDNGRPTPMNERTQAWIQAQIYGTNDEEQKPLRTWTDGKFRLDEKGHLPPNPAKPGIDLSGFTNNYNPLLSFLHWAFVVNHNNIVDHLKKYNPGWDDAKLFDYARKINVASTAQIHTTEWTEDLLQHPTLQAGMHAEYYGLFGPKAKAWLMRFSYRHPWFAKLIRPISKNDVIWGMPGSSWEHHDGPFQVPKHFRFVYRLHEMILSDHEFIEPGTDRTLGRRELIDFIHSNTRPIVEQYGYDVLAYSFVKKSAGALTLKNFPKALTQFRDQQHQKLMDLAEADTFRERTDGTGSYNEFRRSVGEPPVTSFLELTGGDKEMADALSQKFEGDVEKVDAGIGILAEPKPAGFALGFTQFYQFVLNAPRRVKSNRHLTEYYTHKDYTYEGMEWVWHSNGMGGVIARAMKTQPMGGEVIKAMEGVTRWFAPWKDTETFPVRLLDQANADSSAILKATVKTMLLGTLTAFGAWMGVAVWTFSWVPLAAAVLGVPVLLYYKRMLAWRFMQKAWQSAYTDRRRQMFPTLFLGEKWARRSAGLGKLGGRIATYGGAYVAFTLFSTNPIVALFAGLTALAGLGVLKATKQYENTMAILKIALQNRLREGYPTVTTENKELPGKTALERRYWFLVPKSSKQPVARFVSSVRALHEHGLGLFHAMGTAFWSHLLFGPRSQKGLGLKGRWKAGILFSPFAIYIPNMVQAQGVSSSRIYANANNAKGLTAGDVDVAEFNKMFDDYAPGRDYMTAYDFARMREGIRVRAASEGRGGPVTRWLGSIAVKHRTDQLLQLYGDVVANEDKQLVPAISRDMMLRVYQGTAQADIGAERALDGIHPDLRAAKPLDPDAKPKLTFRERLSEGFKKHGWKAVAGIIGFYLVRDLTLYVLIPYLILKGLF